MNDNPNGEQGFGRVWLERGIAAARAGRRSEARESLFRALNDEPQREMAWLWLAAVSDDPRQEQMYLEKVLELNPDNHYAKAGMAHLAKRGLKDLPSLSLIVEDLDKEERAEEKPVVLSEEEEEPDEEVFPDVLPADDKVQAARHELTAASADQSPSVLEEQVKEREVEPLQTRGREEDEEGPVDEGRSGESDESDSVWSEEFEELEGLVSEGEPTGWTSHTPVVDKPVPVQRPQPANAVDWSVAPPRVTPRYADHFDYAPPRPVRRRLDRPAARWRKLLQSGGPISTIVSEAFNSHEMWTIVAATVGLILLAFVIAFFFALSLLSG